MQVKPKGYEGPKNWVFDRAVNQDYKPPIIIPNSKYRTFSAVSWRSSATGYYRSFSPMYVLKHAYGVLDSATGFDLPDNEQIWANHINLSQVLLLEREFESDLIPALSRYSKSNGPILYDIDDHILAFSSIKKFHTFEEGFIRDFWESGNTERLSAVMGMSDLIVTTTQPLSDWYSSKSGIHSVCIRNAIDTVATRWNVEFSKKEDRDYIIIGYMGGATHGADLDLLEPVIDAILEKYPNVKFKFIGYAAHFLFDLIEKWTRDRIIPDFGWSGLEKYPQRMYDIDIGLAPLANNDFNRIGKSDLKYLEYTMSGACTVASNLGQYKEAIKHKKNGLLAKTTDDWIWALSYLLDNPDEITRIHKNAVDDVLTRRSVMETAKDWYKTIVDSRKKWERKH